MHRTSHRLTGLTAALTALAACAACSSNTNSAVTPTVPTVVITETFSQTLTPNGAVIFPFNTTAAGTVAATLTTISPSSGLSLEIDLGTWNGTSCTPQFFTIPATQGATVGAQATGAGSLCTKVSDASGVVTGSQSIIVTVTHF